MSESEDANTEVESGDSPVDLRSRLLQKAQKLHQNENYDELSELLIFAAKIVPEFSSVEHKLLIYTNKKLAQDQVCSWRFLNSANFQNRLGTKPEVLNIKKLIRNRLRTLCREVFEVIQDYIFCKAVNRKNRFRYYELKGDLSRYLAEVEDGLIGQNIAFESLQAYEAAINILANALPKDHSLVKDLPQRFEKFLSNCEHFPNETCLESKNLLDRIRIEVKYVVRKNTKACQTDAKLMVVNEVPIHLTVSKEKHTQT